MFLHDKHILQSKMLTMAHDSLAQGQELAADDRVDKGTPKTVSANHCHTERHTRPGKPYLKRKRV